jgi:hypothetical protein
VCFHTCGRRRDVHRADLSLFRNPELSCSTLVARKADFVWYRARFASVWPPRNSRIQLVDGTYRATSTLAADRLTAECWPILEHSQLDSSVEELFGWRRLRCSIRPVTDDNGTELESRTIILATGSPRFPARYLLVVTNAPGHQSGRSERGAPRHRW